MSTDLSMAVGPPKAVHGPFRKALRNPLVFIPTVVIAIAILVSLALPLLPLPDPIQQDLVKSLAPPSAEHLLGTDQLGRDLLSRLLWGMRASLIAALIAVTVAVVIGVPLGLIAGYAGGLLDQILARIADVVLTLPALILLLTVYTAMGVGINGQMVALGILFAPRIYRVVRAETRNWASLPFITAGRMSGVPHWRILTRYLFPGVRPQVAVQLSYLLGLALVVEAGISFLGVGVRPPHPSLGALLNGASAMLTLDPKLVVLPATLLTILILSLNLLGDRATKEVRGND